MKKKLSSIELIVICRSTLTCDDCLWCEECDKFYELTRSKGKALYPCDLIFMIEGEDDADVSE